MFSTFCARLARELGADGLGEMISTVSKSVVSGDVWKMLMFIQMVPMRG